MKRNEDRQRRRDKRRAKKHRPKKGWRETSGFVPKGEQHIAQLQSDLNRVDWGEMVFQDGEGFLCAFLDEIEVDSYEVGIGRDHEEIHLCPAPLTAEQRAALQKVAQRLAPMYRRDLGEVSEDTTPLQTCRKCGDILGNDEVNAGREECFVCPAAQG
jgi:hypothetical protein